VRFDSVCGNTTVDDPFLSCNITNVDQNERVNEVAAIDIAGGMPGKKCFYLELPNEPLPPEVVVDTCTGIDPVLNSITGRMDFAQGADGELRLQRLKSNAACLCECSATGTSCINRVAMTIWRRFYCFGQDGQPHPGGSYFVEHYPALQYQQVAQTTTTSSSADDGERFTFYAYTNPGFTGPAGVTLPIEYAAQNYSACWYGWTTDECPPQDGGCECANCGVADDPLGLGALIP
jgi:hypothetical protein